MFFDWLLDLIAQAAGWFSAKVAALVPPVPGWVADGAGMVGTVLGHASGLGFWVPLTLFGVVVASVAACFLAGLTVRLVRIAASFLTLGGGA